MVELKEKLQRRVARLLLRHDRRVFRGSFKEFFAHSELPQLEELQAYDTYTKLIALASELLDEILPRIRRQMSFQANHEMLHEEPPLRGQIHWQSSLTRAWNEYPDQPPTRFATTLRKRTFDTPENKLVVAILSAYARELKRMRTQTLFKDVPITESEQAELLQLEDRIRRALATTHFRDLSHRAENFDIPTRIATVEKHLRPGKNAYRDLVAWWRRFESMHIRYQKHPAQKQVLDYEQQMGLLYQLWIVLEIVEFLSERHALENTHVQVNQLSITFTWTPPQGHTQRYRLVYDRQPTDHLVWDNAPGERPDYFITHADSLDISHNGNTIWRDMGVLLDAKCLSGNKKNRAAGSIKRLIADMQLVDSNKGMLLMPNTDNIAHKVITPKTEDRYLGSIDPHLAIHLLALLPMDAALPDHIETMLNTVTTWLPKRAPIKCHGYLQDKDTINPSVTDPQYRDGSQEILAICPKPHISTRCIDLVSPSKDCLKIPEVCHIMGLDIADGAMPPFIQRVQTQADLIESIQRLRELLHDSVSSDDDTPEADQARSQLIHAIGALAEKYFEIRQPDTIDIEEKLVGFFGTYWQQTPAQPRGLSNDVRHMLISGEYVRGELRRANIQDWAACAVQYVRALEREMKLRLYKPCQGELKNRYGGVLAEDKFTFGTTGHIERNKSARERENWQTLLNYVAHPNGVTPQEFERLVQQIEALRTTRNNVAHTDSVDQTLAEDVRQAVLGIPGSTGVLVQLVTMLNPA